VATRPQLVGERSHPTGVSKHVVEEHDFGHLYAPQRVVVDMTILRRCGRFPERRMP